MKNIITPSLINHCITLGCFLSLMSCTSVIAQQRPDQRESMNDRKQLPISIVIDPANPCTNNRTGADNEAGAAKLLLSSQQTNLVETIIKDLNESYIFPEVAQKIEKHFRENLKREVYGEFNEPEKFAALLTDELQQISKDKHLRVFYEPKPRSLSPDQKVQAARDFEEYKEFARTSNYGFERLERLPGNIGYLELRGFVDHELSGETAANAMNFLANTDALIIDLRKNGGGDPATVQLLCSYLFPNDTTHLNDLYFRADNLTRQYWTLPLVPGKRYLNKEVYVLTSKRTFSGAEEFTYNLKNLKRATIIGEQTGGGANPGDVVHLDEHFSIFIPTGRAISPITKTNWEGTGVTPDIEVPAEEALLVAQTKALASILLTIPESKRKEAIQAELAAKEKELKELQAHP